LPWSLWQLLGRLRLLPAQPFRCLSARSTSERLLQIGDVTVFVAFAETLPPPIRKDREAFAVLFVVKRTFTLKTATGSPQLYSASLAVPWQRITRTSPQQIISTDVN
jgi:hypothetical protein